MNKLNALKDALLRVTDNVFHFEKNGSEMNQYIVWSEEYKERSFADNRIIREIECGTIDFFTRIEFDNMVNSIEKELSYSAIYFKLVSIQRELETGYIHYEWEFQIG
ncbi:hypothetical protein [Anaerorhabdus sp.]|uniref:hypothetical protein n=1 Tax=Anaerorhabdus sp. TaxID=1872524 RepID=UPI002FC716C5